MDITVRHLDCCYTISISLDDSVSNLKNKINEEIGLDPLWFDVEYEGTLLDIRKNVFSFGISSSSEIEIVMNTRKQALEALKSKGLIPHINTYVKCISHNDIEGLLDLIVCKVEFGPKDSSTAYNALRSAVLTGRVDLCKALLQVVNPKVINNQQGPTILNLLIALPNEERTTNDSMCAIFEQLIEAGFSVQGTAETHIGARECTIFHVLALKTGASELYCRLARIFHNAGGDPNETLRQANTAIIEACKTSNFPMVKTLFELGASVSGPGKQNVLLHTTSHDILLWLLNNIESEQKSILLKSKCPAGNTPLHYAAKNGSLECIHALVQHGASVENDKSRQTVLNAAIQYGGPEVVMEVLRLGHPIIYSDSVQSPLRSACTTIIGMANVVKEIFRIGGSGIEKANFCIDNKQRKTPLHYLMMSVSDVDEANDIINVLIDNGADITLPDSDGITPLIQVCSNPQASKRMAFLLSKNRISETISTADSNGKTPVYEAAVHATPENFEKLLDMGADVNSCDNRRIYPIIRILTRRDGINERLVRKLLSCGADKFVTDKHGFTPQNHAMRAGCGIRVFDLLCTKERETVPAAPSPPTVSPVRIAAVGGGPPPVPLMNH